MRATTSSKCCGRMIMQPIETPDQQLAAAVNSAVTDRDVVLAAESYAQVSIGYSPGEGE